MFGRIRFGQKVTKAGDIGIDFLQRLAIHHQHTLKQTAVQHSDNLQFGRRTVFVWKRDNIADALLQAVHQRVHIADDRISGNVAGTLNGLAQPFPRIRSRSIRKTKPTTGNEFRSCPQQRRKSRLIQIHAAGILARPTGK